MFDPGVLGGSELDAVVSSLSVRGLEKSRQRWEEHWNSALDDDDLKWLTGTAHCNSLRLPVGYYTLGPSFCRNTPFAMQPAEVYVDAWRAVKRICRMCCGHGVGVLLVFQAMPGGANGAIHSGTSTGRAELWGNQTYLDLASDCVRFMAGEIAGCAEFASVVGLQVCGEAISGAPGIYDWYTSVIGVVTAIDPSLHVYVSDAWDLDETVVYAKGKNRFRGQLSCPIVVDTHRYYNHRQEHGDEHTGGVLARVSTEFGGIVPSGSRSVMEGDGVAALYVGEYSCALPPRLTRDLRDDDTDGLTIKFGQAQSQCWQASTSGAAFFTWKKTDMGNATWDFPRQLAMGAISAPTYMSLTAGGVRSKLDAVDAKRSPCMTSAVDRHCKHYERLGKRNHHWRYADGWHLGWMDGRAFFAGRLERRARMPTEPRGDRGQRRPLEGDDVVGADEIGHGMLALWTMKRVAQEIEGPGQRYNSRTIWVWEEGFQDGISAFYACLHL